MTLDMPPFVCAVMKHRHSVYFHLIFLVFLLFVQQKINKVIADKLLHIIRPCSRTFRHQDVLYSVLEWKLSLVSDVLVGLPCVYLSITAWASKYSLYVAVVCLLRFLRSGNFSAEIKKEVLIVPTQSSTPAMKYGCDLKAWNWTKALWSGNLRRQQLWHGCLHCRWKQSRGVLFSLPVCLHSAFYSKQSLTELPSLFEMHVIQESIKLKFWKLSFN